MKKLILILSLGLSITLTGCSSKEDVVFNSKGVSIANSEEKIIVNELLGKRELKEINSEFQDSKVYDYQFKDEIGTILELDTELSDSQKDILFIYLLTGLDISKNLANDIDSNFIKSYVDKCNDDVITSFYSSIHNNEKYIRIYDYQQNIDTITKVVANYIENKIGYELTEKGLDTINKLVENDIISSLNQKELEYIIESYKIDDDLKYVYAPDLTYFNFETMTNPFNGKEQKIRTELDTSLKPTNLTILSNELNDNAECIQTFRTNVKEGEVITLIAHKDPNGEISGAFNNFYPDGRNCTAIVYDNNDLLENENTVELSGNFINNRWIKFSEDDEKEIYKLNITTSGVLELKISIDAFNYLHGYSIWI